MTTPTVASNAYLNLARLAEPLTGPSSSVDGASGGFGAGLDSGGHVGRFGSMVEQALTGVADAGREADRQSASLATGRADIVDVVTAVAESETAMETLVSVRDRVIAAYEEIMRMPI